MRVETFLPNNRRLTIKARLVTLTAGMTALLSGASSLTAANGPSLSSVENEYYKLTTIPIPAGIVLEAGAIQVLPGDRIAVSTRLGDIYFVDGAMAQDFQPESVKFIKFASGLHEVLGLTTKGDGWIYATQRGEVTRLKDTNHDDKADLIETYADGWEIGGDYHEYAFGSKFDPSGNMMVVLCLTGSFSSDHAFRGWGMRITPDGKTLASVSGIRSPGGIGTNSVGDLFYTDNQGPWNGTCWLKPLKEGTLVGHPGGFKWYSNPQAKHLGPAPTEPKSGSRLHIERERIPQLNPPAIGFPYNKMGQSASGITVDATEGKFGPFHRQMFVGDQTWSTVMRVVLEKVNGIYQGACIPFREGLASGSLSLEMTGQGLFVGGTDRGWGARGGKPFALQRLNWTGKNPFEIHNIRIQPDGFELEFTEALDAGTASSLSSYQLATWTYIYQSNYGSPEVDPTKPEIKEVKVGADGKSVRLVTTPVVGHLHEIKLPGLKNKSGQGILHPVAYYWVNEIPKP